MCTLRMHGLASHIISKEGDSKCVFLVYYSHSTDYEPPGTFARLWPMRGFCTCFFMSIQHRYNLATTSRRHRGPSTTCSSTSNNPLRNFCTKSKSINFCFTSNTCLITTIMIFTLTKAPFTHTTSNVTHVMSDIIT